MKRSCLAMIGLTASLACVAAFGDARGYHLLKKIPFPAAEGGSEYFDYITFDPTARRIYLSHGTEVPIPTRSSRRRPACTGQKPAFHCSQTGSEPLAMP